MLSQHKEAGIAFEVQRGGGRLTVAQAAVVVRQPRSSGPLARRCQHRLARFLALSSLMFVQGRDLLQRSFLARQADGRAEVGSVALSGRKRQDVQER